MGNFDPPKPPSRGAFAPRNDDVRWPERDARSLTEEEAFFYIQHPLAARRDFRDGVQGALWRRIDRIFKQAAEINSLRYQAYMARERPARPVDVVSAAGAMRMKLTYGGLPEQPEPPGPAADRADAGGAVTPLGRHRTPHRDRREDDAAG